VRPNARSHILGAVVVASEARRPCPSAPAARPVRNKRFRAARFKFRCVCDAASAPLQLLLPVTVCCETCVARDTLPHLPLVPHSSAPFSRLASGNPECGGRVSGFRLPGLSRGKAQRRPRNLKAALLPPLKHSLLKALCRKCVAWETQLQYINITLHKYITNKHLSVHW
jgi:hypothetical protein